MRVLVCGAGVIGAAVAYYLTLRGLRPVLVERHAVACAASGKSGGFLARDWCDGSPLGPLARASFALHRELPAALPRDYGYRALDTLLVADGGGQRSRPGPAGGRDAWLDGSGTVRGCIGDTDSTAQVDPGPFTEALVEAALAGGAELRRGAVRGVTLSEAGRRLRGVVVDDTELRADVAVFALGPWTSQLARWLPVPPVAGLKGNSIVLQPERPVPAEALFVESSDPEAGSISPEIFPRPGGEVYVCGMADDLPLPEEPQRVEPSESACAVLARVAGRLSSALAGAAVLRRQACFRPITADALPLLGPVTGVAGAYLATGHNCWGILNAPASGKALAELIVDGRATTVDLGPFDPARLRRTALSV